MKKTKFKASDFENQNSSLRKTFDEAVAKERKEEWESRFDERFVDPFMHSLQDNEAPEIKDFIAQELARQKEGIIEIINSYNGDACYAKDDIINKIKEK